MAEAEKGKEIAETVEYLFQREKELSNYSDKLRESVERIENIFGKKWQCQICDWEDQHSSHYKYAQSYVNCYYNKKSEIPDKIEGRKVKVVDRDYDVGRWGDPDKKLIYVRKNEDIHEFTPKVEISFDMVDAEPFFVSEQNEWRLTLEDHELKALGYDQSYRENDVRYEQTEEFPEMGREILKELVKSGRITKFVDIVKEKLDRTTEEYEKVSKMAEKLASAL